MSSSLYTKSSLNKLANKENHRAKDSTGESENEPLLDAGGASTESSEQQSVSYDLAKELWRCPKCHSGLRLNKTTWSCENRHSFDCARQGYTNLLLANKKGSNEPGDNREMIDARRSFLRKGFYQPLVDKLRSVFQVEYDRLNNAEPFSIVDLGCGEGYYLESIISNPKKNLDNIRMFSLDISKVAVQRAAVSGSSQKLKNKEDNKDSDDTNNELDQKLSQTQSSYFAVASSYDIPLFDQSIHLALAIFSPISIPEITRILAGDGRFVRVSPGPRHFYQLKQKIYSDITLHPEPETPDGFILQKREDISFNINLTNKEDIFHLLSMTPLNWHGNVEAKKELLEEPSFSTECDFIVQVFSKKYIFES